MNSANDRRRRPREMRYGLPSSLVSLQSKAARSVWAIDASWRRRLDVNSLDGVHPSAARAAETPVWLCRFEVRDFGHALLRRTREPTSDRQRRPQRAVHEPLAVLLGVPYDRNQ